jgi:hypothetical protein
VAIRSSKALARNLRKGSPVILGRPEDCRDLSKLPVSKWKGRTVSAQTIRHLCASSSGPEALKFDGVRITGALNLSNLTVQCMLVLSNCLFTDGIILENARLAGVDFSGCTFLHDVSAKNLRCGPLVMRNVVAKGIVNLSHAAIDGTFECQDAVFESPLPESLLIRGTTITRNALLARAHVGGAVSASALAIQGALMCTDMTIDGTTWVEGQLDPFGEPRRAGVGAARVAFILDYAHIEGPVHMSGSSAGKSFKACGIVRMFGAHMGALTCERATLKSPGGICLTLERAVVRNAVQLRHGFEAIGTIRLYAAEIGDALEMDGANLSAADGWALDAQRAHVAGPLMLRHDFTANGAVVFRNATIGSFVDCSGGSFHMTGSPSTPSSPHDQYFRGLALAFDYASIGGDLYLRNGFCAKGRIELTLTRIAGSLVLGGHFGACVENKGRVIAAFGLVAGRAIYLQNLKATGIIDLQHSSCTVLQDEFTSWPLRDPTPKGAPGRQPRNRIHSLLRRWGLLQVRPRRERTYSSGILWSGLVYETIESPDPDLEWKQRQRIFLEKVIDWKKPQPYLQLAKFYERTGSATIAREVQIARLNAAYHPLNPSKLFLRPLIGYGYKPLRAALFLALVALIGGLAFSYAARNNLLVPTHPPQGGQMVVSSLCHPQIYPCVHPYAYSVDALLPVLNLHERDFWAPNVMEAPWIGGLAWFLNGIGWIVGLLVIAGFTNLVRKELHTSGKRTCRYLTKCAQCDPWPQGTRRLSFREQRHIGVDRWNAATHHTDCFGGLFHASSSAAPGMFGGFVWAGGGAVSGHEEHR